jgi:hypothetical protein
VTTSSKWWVRWTHEPSGTLSDVVSIREPKTEPVLEMPSPVHRVGEAPPALRGCEPVLQHAMSGKPGDPLVLTVNGRFPSARIPMNSVWGHGGHHAGGQEA